MWLVVHSLETAQLLSAGDSFSGISSFEACKYSGDVETTVLIREQANNIFLATVVATDGDQVRTWQKRGFCDVNSRKVIMAPSEEGAEEGDMTIVCDFSNEDTAQCKIVTNDFAQQCGTSHLRRDPIGG